MLFYGKIYTANKNFTRPPVATVATNSKSANVFITREGKSVESSDEEVDERRIYKGAENRLTMQQTYSHKFRCIYELQPYPFDTQVKQKFVTGRDTCFSLFISFRNVRSTLC